MQLEHDQGVFLHHNSNMRDLDLLTNDVLVPVDEMGSFAVRRQKQEGVGIGGESAEQLAAMRGERKQAEAMAARAQARWDAAERQVAEEDRQAAEQERQAADRQEVERQVADGMCPCILNMSSVRTELVLDGVCV